jgi:hypothetical protein
MLQRLRLRGLDLDQSFQAFSLMLFSPFLRERVCVKECLTFCDKLIGLHFFAKQPAEFVAEYERMVERLNKLLPEMPMPSLANPPWAMISLDMRNGLIPWVTPGFGEFLRILLLANDGRFEGVFGDELPIAFVLHGGPGDSKGTAFRLATPSGTVRASAEYWLVRTYLPRAEQRLHANLAPETDGRTFSMHRYIYQHGVEKYVYFDTTRSLGREKEDFLECLRELSDKGWFGSCRAVKRGVKVAAGSSERQEKPEGNGGEQRAHQGEATPTSGDRIGQTAAQKFISICWRIGFRIKQFGSPPANR